MLLHNLGAKYCLDYSAPESENFIFFKRILETNLRLTSDKQGDIHIALCEMDGARTGRLPRRCAPRNDNGDRHKLPISNEQDRGRRGNAHIATLDRQLYKNLEIS